MAAAASSRWYEARRSRTRDGRNHGNSTVSRNQAEPEGQNLRRPRQLFVVLGKGMTGGARPNSTEMNALGVEVRWLSTRCMWRTLWMDGASVQPPCRAASVQGRAAHPQ
jgi:hypothetical protein